MRSYFPKEERKIFFFAVGLVAIYVIFSFGPFLIFENNILKLPFYHFVKQFSFFKGMRTPGRFGFFVLLFASIAVCFFLANLLKNRSKAFQSVVVGILGILFLYDNRFQIPLMDFQPPEEAFYQKLGTVLAKEDVVYELPIHSKNSALEEISLNVNQMLGSTFHWRKILAGYSGKFPKKYFEFRDQENIWSDKNSNAAIAEHYRREGISVMVFSRKLYSGKNSKRWIQFFESQKVLFDDQDRIVISIAK